MAVQARVAVFVMAISLSASAFAAQLFQDFTTEPADWVENGSRTSPQNFGYQPAPSANAGGAPGEAGGLIVREPLAFYHTSVGTLDPSTQALSMSGLRQETEGGTNEYIGWHDPTAGPPRSGGSLIGFRFDNTVFRVFVSDGDVTRLDSAVGGPNPESFTFDYTPTPTGATITGSVTDSVAGTTPFSFSLTEGERDTILDMTHFGLVSLGSDGTASGNVFYDNLNYTSIIPEPASLGLVAMGALAGMRRRRS